MKKQSLLIGAALLIGAFFIYRGFGGPDHSPSAAQPGAAMANVLVPELSAATRDGEALFVRSCADCHGTNAAGRDGIAPPLVHKIYEPNHHGDASFYLAARNGVRAHHWRFGDMPPVEGLADTDIAKIVFYVRELQRANGIH
ncbi:Cytochrome c [Hoeflea phototrophica DFL-43]|jgi:mono/diheme cytochrome c family protein|uniref:Cytochrome c n=1 Tax=Hoeflea phototrophica (strain DSM 17068 / NCIMB 14078 / DFL-43) TaxID=411684 RepID=A9CW01_HOEPD|nr:cytochrome c [Hoeflea phototrophica]EDQ35447.1 Cytochrome c [Hoeflea phototrophica DFL-43]